MRIWRSLSICTAALVLTAGALAQTAPVAGPGATPPQTAAVARTPKVFPDSLPTKEFARIVRDFSEEGGSFFSDNLLSNETSYLHIVDKLKQIGGTGGAYLGVGPEQNFTYIAKIRPRVAFIIDVRRMAATQQLMYKAIFHSSADRPAFLARLLSRPLAKNKTLSPDAPLNELLTYFNSAPIDEEFFKANLAEFERLIQKEFEYPLSTVELQELAYVLRNFKDEGLHMTYRWTGGYMPGYFPTLREVLAETDLSGKQGNFLASTEDYQFVRGMQLKNLIIPVTGDFAGAKALTQIADYLRENGLTLTAFYTSNVEQYLFDSQVFEAFARNVRRMPITDRSLFIRSVLSRFGHPAMSPGHQFVVLLQRIPDFLRDFGEGRYRHYSELTNTNFIAPAPR